MRDRNLEALRREHKSKFKARNTSSVKNQRERGGAALEQTKEETRKEKLGEKQFGVKSGWKSKRLRTRQKGKRIYAHKPVKGKVDSLLLEYSTTDNMTVSLFFDEVNGLYRLKSMMTSTV